MSRQELLDEINEILEENGGFADNEEILVTATGIDSFGVAMLFLELDNRYRCYPKELEEKIDWSTYTVGDVINTILKV